MEADPGHPDGRPRRLQVAVVWAVVAVCLAAGTLPIVAPRLPASDDPNAISVGRALEHVKFIAQEPHVMGTPEIERVRQYLVETLADAGLEPETMAIETPDYFGEPGGTVEVVNVLARIPGTGDGSAVLLMAHHDTVPTTPGANDNSTAVAALLETGRVLAAGSPPPHDVILLFTDGEEPTPRYGAWGFAEFHPWFDDVALAVNFEGIGVAGPTMLMELNGPTGELVSRLTDSVADPVAFSFMSKTAELIGGAATDFDVFRDRGVPGFNFAYLRGSPVYHTPRDSLDRVNERGLAHHGSLALGIAQKLDSSDIGAARDDAVFFTVLDGYVVRYSSSAAVVTALAALLVVVGALWLRVGRRDSTVRAMLSGFGWVSLAAVVSVLAATAIWFVLVNIRGDMGLIESYLYFAGLIGLAGVGWYSVQERTVERSDPFAGLLLLWLVLVLTTGLVLPAIGYLFVWPAIAAGIAGLAIANGRRYWMRLMATAVVALVTLVVLVPAIDTYYQFATPRPGNPDSELPAMIVLPAFLAFLSIGLIAAQVPQSPDEPGQTA